MRIIDCFGAAVFAAFFMIPLTVSAQKPPRKSKLPPALAEISGMTIRTGKSGKEIWMLNDSRNPPILFCAKANESGFDFSKIEQTKLPALNRDWEDLTSDPAGNLYIGDFGNNANRRKDLKIFVFQPETGRFDSILFKYPDQTAFPPEREADWNFNCEAMVFFRDSLHLFSKNAFVGNGECKHYALPARPGNYVAQFRRSIPLKNRVVTGAAISPDGKELVLISYFFGKKWGFLPRSKASVFSFKSFPGSDFFRGSVRKHKLRKFLIHRQWESIAWFDERFWLIGNERKFHFKPTIRRFSI